MYYSVTDNSKSRPANFNPEDSWNPTFNFYIPAAISTFAATNFNGGAVLAKGIFSRVGIRKLVWEILNPDTEFKSCEDDYLQDKVNMENAISLLKNSQTRVLKPFTNEFLTAFLEYCLESKSLPQKSLRDSKWETCVGKITVTTFRALAKKLVPNTDYGFNQY